MTRMKESGIDWIGQIPEEWEMSKIRYLVTTRSEKRITDSSVPYIGLENIESQTGKFVKTGIQVDKSENIVVEIGDVLFGKLRPYLRKYWRATFTSTASSEFLVFQSSELDMNFLYYAIQSDSFIEEVNTSTYGSKMPRASWEYIKNMRIAFPTSLVEQQKIADFLDKKIVQLDKVKSLLEEQIQKLKDYRASLIYETVTKGLDKTVPMKDSGIDWIGQIPEEWEVSKLEQYVDIFGRIGFRGYTTNDIVNEGEGAISYSPSNIIDYSVIDNNNTYISWSKYDESPEIQIKTGDVLYVKTGSSYGKAGIVNKLSNKATINPQLVVLKPKKNTDSRLINYFLNSSVGKDQSELIVGGSTIPTITQESIKKMIFPKMSFEEQQKIVDFLDKKTIQIDKLIQIKNQQIENINKQRQTLIYDYVTGKRRV